MAFAHNHDNPTAGMTFQHANQCINCGRFNGSKKCDAYPDEIPAAIWDDAIAHNAPMPRDHGLQFIEPNTGEPMTVSKI